MAEKLRSTVKLAKVKSVYNYHIFSVRLTQEAENGFVVKLGDIEADNIEVSGMQVPATGDGKLVVIANPALVYDNLNPSTKGLENRYFMEAGEVVRAYELVENDILGVSTLGIEGVAVEGEYLVAGNGMKLVPSPTPITNGFCAKVIRFDQIGGALSLNVTQTPTKYVMMEILSN